MIVRHFSKLFVDPSMTLLGESTVFSEAFPLFKFVDDQCGSFDVQSGSQHVVDLSFQSGDLVFVGNFLIGRGELVRGLGCDAAEPSRQLDGGKEVNESERGEAYDVRKGICACESGDYASRHLCVR